MGLTGGDVIVQLEAELERHRNGQNDLGTHKKNWEDAKAALPGHQKTHDHHQGYVPAHPSPFRTRFCRKHMCGTCQEPVPISMLNLHLHETAIEHDVERDQDTLGVFAQDSAFCAASVLSVAAPAAYRLARDAANAAAAKEAEANRLKPNHEEHTKALGPLESEHARLAK